MGTAEGVAQVNEIGLIGDVGSADLGRPVFPKRLPYRQIQGAIAGQVVRPVAVQETGAVTEVS